MISKDSIAMIGAGLAGPLMATFLTRHGYQVEIYERRSDMRKKKQSSGRSINLALSRRGIEALKNVGLYKKVKPNLIPMSGRMIHDIDGSTHFQPYGQNNREVIYSISRSFLNKAVMDHAEDTGKVDIHFNSKLIDIDVHNSKLIFDDGTKQFTRVFGSDGASSMVRKAICKISSVKFSREELNHGYKELTILSKQNGDYQIAPNVLHIWPRGEFMLIALPNKDGSFTCTLFLPSYGKESFSSLDKKGNILTFFKKYFPDVLDFIPDLEEQYRKNPLGRLGTVYCDKWHYKDKLLIFGDAAHAIVPFFGQGMNASFQDCMVIDSIIDKHKDNWVKIFDKFSETHVANGHAIAKMALENYVEMRNSVNDNLYQKRRKLELELEKKFQARFIPRYSMVSFHTLPYAEVYSRGEVQLEILNLFLKNQISESELSGRILNEFQPMI